jgi:hypothetical protein
MRANELLVERVVNAFDEIKKQQYAQQVWNILQASYAGLPGGFGTASSIEELMEKLGLWKIIVRNGRVTAVNVYRDQHGRKSIASGTDGTSQGKLDYKMIKSEDVRLGRAWAEVSGAPEAILSKMGAKPIPSKFAKILTGKHIMSYDPDGYHYTRLIAGEPREKIMYGVVNLSSELKQQLENSGIQVNQLPNDIFKS